MLTLPIPLLASLFSSFGNAQRDKRHPPAHIDARTPVEGVFLADKHASIAANARPAARRASLTISSFSPLKVRPLASSAPVTLTFSPAQETLAKGKMKQQSSTTPAADSHLRHTRESILP